MQTKTKVNIREEGWQAVMLRTAIQWQMVKLIRQLPNVENDINSELHRLADEWELIN
jgi:hypothetical protein